MPWYILRLHQSLQFSEFSSLTWPFPLFQDLQEGYSKGNPMLLFVLFLLYTLFPDKHVFLYVFLRPAQPVNNGLMQVSLTLLHVLGMHARAKLAIRITHSFSTQYLVPFEALLDKCHLAPGTYSYYYWCDFFLVQLFTYRNFLHLEIFLASRNVEKSGQQSTSLLKTTARSQKTADTIFQ